MSNLFYYTGFRHLLVKPWRTLLTVLGISLGVSLYVGIHIINRSTLNSFKETIDSMAGKATLTVFGSETGFPEDRLDLIQKTQGVKFAVPMVTNHVYLTGNAHTTETLMILGVDLLKEQSVRSYKTTDEQVIEDPLSFLNQPDSIIVTRSFALAHHFKIDDTFDVATAGGHKKLTVRGLLTPDGPAKAYGGALAIMDIDGARMTFGKEGKLDRVDVVTADNANIDQVAQELVKNLGPGYRAERPQTQSQGVEKMIGSYQAMLSFFSTIALMVGVFFVFNSVGTSVSERIKEIGTLRALGATKMKVLSLFLFEALLMGLVGSLIGVLLGRLVAAFLVSMVSRSLSIQLFTTVQTAHLSFGVSDLLNGVAIGLGATIIAALWPSLKASSISPLWAMKRITSNSFRVKKLGLGPAINSGLILTGYFVISSYLHWGAKSFVLEILGEFSSIVGPALLAPALAALLFSILKALGLGTSGACGRLAKDNLTRNPKRTGSNVTVLMVGLVLVIIVAALDSSFRKSIVSWLDRNLHHDLIVTSYGNFTTQQTQPLREELGKSLRQIPGVEVTTGDNYQGFRFVHFQYEGKQLSLKAFDPPLKGESYDLYAVKDRPSEEAGRDFYTSRDYTIFISQNFSVHFKKKTGDHVEIITPAGNRSFRIVGIVDDYGSPEGVIYMSRPTYKKLWSDKLVDGFGIHILPGFGLASVRKKIDDTFGRVYDVMTLSNSEIRGSVLKNIDESLSYTRAIEGLAFLVALLSLMNTFLINVAERTRELGMLRAVGMSRNQVRMMIVQEVLLQGGLGAVVAIALGAGIAYMWVTFSLSQLLGWVVPFAFPWKGILITAGASIVIPLLAGLYPAHRAASVEICEALNQ
jgi:putative ABC transport system permease protein